MAGVIFRRIGGRIIPMISKGLKQTKMNTPEIRSQVAHQIRASRKGKGLFGGSHAMIDFNGSGISFQVPKKGWPLTVTTSKTTGRGSQERGRKIITHFMRKDSSWFMYQFNNKVKKIKGSGG